MKEKFPGHGKLLGLVATGAMAFGGAGCADTGISPKNIDSPTQPTTSLRATETPSQAVGDPGELKLPFEGTWYLNAGPHNYKLPGLPNPVSIENVVAGELDFAPRTVINCTDNPHAIAPDANVAASASGKITIVGDEKNQRDPFHSIVEIKHLDGRSTRYTHVANIKVKVGDEVLVGQVLGNPSCEYPPGGHTTGLHLDFSVFKNGQPVDSRDIELSGWKPFGDLNYQGGMKKGNETRIGNGRRCAPEDNCGTRNDLDGFPTSRAKPPTPKPPPTQSPTPRLTASPTVVAAPPKPTETKCSPNPLKIVVTNVEINNIITCSRTIEETGEVFAVENEDYAIIYHKDDESFLIYISSSPFDEVRQKAENNFLQTLGINEDSACKLNVTIGTPYFANPDESGIIYPLSFCP